MQAGISNELHDLCKDAKDYSGCIEINKNQVSNKLNVADNYNKYPVPRYEDFERCSKITKGLDYPIETCYLKREVEKNIIFEILKDIKSNNNMFENTNFNSLANYLEYTQQCKYLDIYDFNENIQEFSPIKSKKYYTFKKFCAKNFFEL